MPEILFNFFHCMSSMKYCKSKDKVGYLNNLKEFKRIS